MPTECWPGWCSFKSSCYKIVERHLNFSEAEQNCLQQAAHLTAVQSLAENNFVAGLATPEANLWIGFNDRTEEGHWVWTSTSESGTYINWDVGQPTRRFSYIRDCAFLASSRRSRGSWHSENCAARLSSVCEKGTVNILSLRIRFAEQRAP